jgi:hypothetical protein
MRGAGTILVLALSGCHLLLPLGSSDGNGSREHRSDGPRATDGRTDALVLDGQGWRSVYTLEPLERCPSGLEPVEGGCAIPWELECGDANVVSWTIPVGTAYQAVRGFARGLQWHSTDGFAVLLRGTPGHPTVDEVYVEGVSITRGQPRQHVWTYVCGLMRTGGSSCPCWQGGLPAPPFVGTHYTCDSGNHTDGWEEIWYTDDPLWDDNSSRGGCGTDPSPGWFEVDLGSKSSDPLEVRIMFDDCDENVALTALQLWVR